MWAVLRSLLPGSRLRIFVLMSLPPVSSLGCLTGVVGEGESQMGLVFEKEASLCSRLLLPKGQLLGGKAPGGRIIQLTPRGHLLCTGWAPGRSPGWTQRSQHLQGARRSPSRSWGSFQDRRLTPFLRQHVPGCLVSLRAAEVSTESRLPEKAMLRQAGRVVRMDLMGACLCCLGFWAVNLFNSGTSRKAVWGLPR